MNFTIFNHGDRANCPICGGLLSRYRTIDFVCHDCGSYFFPVRDGQTDRELVYECIKGDKTNGIAV